MAASPVSSLNRNRAFRGKRLRGSPVSMARIFGGSVTSIYSPEPSAMSQVYFLPSCCNIAFIGRPPVFSNDSGPTKVHQEKFPDYPLSFSVAVHRSSAGWVAGRFAAAEFLRAFADRRLGGRVAHLNLPRHIARIERGERVGAPRRPQVHHPM